MARFNFSAASLMALVHVADIALGEFSGFNLFQDLVKTGSVREGRGKPVACQS